MRSLACDDRLLEKKINQKKVYFLEFINIIFCLAINAKSHIYGVSWLVYRQCVYYLWKV